MALATAHKVLVDYNWAWADLHALVARTLGPYEQAADPKLIADDPPVRLSPNQALSMSLVLHELMTNAVKHGALSAPTGRIADVANERSQRPTRIAPCRQPKGRNWTLAAFGRLLRSPPGCHGAQWRRRAEPVATENYSYAIAL